MNNAKPQAMAATGIYERVLSLLPSDNGGKYAFLDAGAGSGALSYLLKEKSFQVMACDINPKQFQVPGITCKQADLNEKIPFENNSFDYVISLETIEHLEDPWTFLREVLRVLKHKGQLIVSTPNLCHLSSRIFFLLFGRFIPFWARRYMESNWHINPIFPWELEFILEETGFKVIKKTYNEGKLLPIFKPFIKNGKLYFGSPVSLSYLPKNEIFGENLIVVAQKY